MTEKALHIFIALPLFFIAFEKSRVSFLERK